MGAKLGLLTLREQLRLRVFENRVLRMFAAKRDVVTGDWRKLHNDELYNLNSSPNRMIKSRRMIMARHVARMGEERNAYTIWVGKSEG
jgi:hypothetical protein